MMISERPNNPRGKKRLMRRPGRMRSGDAVWDKDISYAAHRLQVQRQFGVFFDLAAQARDLHVNRTLKSDTETRAKIAARESAPCIGGEKLKQCGFGTRELDRLALAAELRALRIEHRIAHFHFAMRG